jgi:hypothetical protein
MSLSVFPVLAQQKTDREAAGLAGLVKTVQSTSADYAGDKIVGTGFLKRGGDLTSYDRAGHEIERKPVSDFGEPMGSLNKRYDALGLLVETVWNDPNLAATQKEIYRYENGKLAEVSSYSGDTLVAKTSKSYDPAQRLSIETYSDPTKTVAKTLFKYDDKNNLIEVSFYLADGSKAIAPVGPCLGGHRVTFSYDEKGRIKTKEIFDDDGIRKKGFRFAYDDKGNTVEYVIESSSSMVRFVYKYEFDAKGNWTKQIATGTSKENGLDVFGKPATPYVRTTVTNREITYY